MNINKPVRRVRTRYAPSPTGFQHIGGIRTALYCYLFAQKHHGDFILRIEDTDQSRYVEEAEDYLVEALKWCGIHYSEGIHVGGKHAPYRQSERKPLYIRYAKQLLESGHAYYAFDTPEELEAMRNRATHSQYGALTRMDMCNSLTLPPDEVLARLEAETPYVIRLCIPPDEYVTVHDLVRGAVTVNSNELDDKVLMKSDGMPTYHLANVVDDYLMEITHVIRGEEWLPSTPLHVLLYRFLGWEHVMPAFAHVPLMLNPDGKGKLSKRNGDRYGFPVFPLAWHNKSTDEKANGFREMGFLPEAFINMLAFFGWNPGTDQELFSLPQLIDAFSIERISKSGAKFDFDKAKWFNQQYLKAMSNDELAQISLSIDKQHKAFGKDATYLAKTFGLMKERISFVSEIWTQGAYFFSPDFAYDEKVVASKWKRERVPFFQYLDSQLGCLAQWEEADIEECTKNTAKEHQLGLGEVLPLLRVMLTGITSGPSVFGTAALLGKTQTSERIHKFMKQNAFL